MRIKTLYVALIAGLVAAPAIASADPLVNLGQFVNNTQPGVSTSCSGQFAERLVEQFHQEAKRIQVLWGLFSYSKIEVKQTFETELKYSFTCHTDFSALTVNGGGGAFRQVGIE